MKRWNTQAPKIVIILRSVMLGGLCEVLLQNRQTLREILLPHSVSLESIFWNGPIGFQAVTVGVREMLELCFAKQTSRSKPNCKPKESVSFRYAYFFSSVEITLLLQYEAYVASTQLCV
jgi:hypothetical protein